MFSSKNLGTSKLRYQHKITIFNEIRENEPISRIELCKKTNISKPTVTRIVSELTQDGIVNEIGVVETKSGRKPIMLVINSDVYYSIGVFLTRRHIRTVLVNIKNEIISIKEKDIKSSTDSRQLQEDIKNSIDAIFNTVKDKSKVLGIGIGAPGIVDDEMGIVLDYGGIEHYKDLKIKEYLENNFDCCVYVDNNANTRVLAESWNGFGKDYDNIVSIICDSGIGAGIVVDGKILRGNDNITGEIGHMKVQMGGRECQCGQSGCVEAYASTYSVENILSSKYEKKISFETALKMENEGNETAGEVLSTAREALAIAISNLLGTINPQAVILSGEFFEYNSNYYDEIIQRVQNISFGKEYTNVDFYHRDRGSKINALGAALLVFQTVFYN